jgi:hypothetical protein
LDARVLVLRRFLHIRVQPASASQCPFLSKSKGELIVKSLATRLAHLYVSTLVASVLGVLTETRISLLHAAQQGEVEFNIPAQPLAAALTEVESQAKVQVLFDEGLVKRGESTGLERALPSAGCPQPASARHRLDRLLLERCHIHCAADKIALGARG